MDHEFRRRRKRPTCYPQEDDVDKSIGERTGWASILVDERRLPYFVVNVVDVLYERSRVLACLVAREHKQLGRLWDAAGAVTLTILPRREAKFYELKALPKPVMINPQERANPRRSGIRVASDASRSVFSSRSAGSFTSSSPPSSASPLAARLLNLPSKAGSPLPPIIPPTKPEQLFDDFSRMNDEIYDLIALALRGYVSSWYHKLSPRDKEFVPEISTVVVAVIQALERRIQSADLDHLLLVDIPALITQHYNDYRLARAKVHTSYASGGPQDSDAHAALAHIFHNIQSHLAVSPDGAIDGTYLRQAVDHVFKSCLPPQDWGSDMERSIVREILVRPVLGSVIDKLSQPWFLHSIALSLLGSPRPVEVRLRS